MTLSSFCRSQLGLILRVGLTLKSSSKITLGLILRVGLIIGETRYITIIFNVSHFYCRTFSLQLTKFLKNLHGYQALPIIPRYTFPLEPVIWWSANAFVSGAGCLGFKPRPVKSDTVLPTLRHIFKRTYVARAQL